MGRYGQRDPENSQGLPQGGCRELALGPSVERQILESFSFCRSKKIPRKFGKTSDTPTGARGRVDQGVGFGAVRELHFGRIPLELGAGQLDRDHAEHSELGQWTAVREI